MWIKEYRLANKEGRNMKAETQQGPDFIILAQAAGITCGTRITFVPGVQALYSEALKNIFT